MSASPGGSSDPGAWAGGEFGVGRCVVAPNAGAMTLDGTNTWVLRSAAGGPSIVVDPGPLDRRHLDDVAAAADEVAVVLLTHHHADHSEAARAFAMRVGCQVRALDPSHRLGGEGLGEGDVVTAGDLEIRVIATPGHTSDSLSFLVPEAGAVLTGDTVLGRGTTMVAHPDGQLGAYLSSLVRLRELAAANEVLCIWPGHGPVIDDALPVLDYYLTHRRARLEQVRQVRTALQAEPGRGHTSAEGLAREIVRIVYADVDPVLWGAAELSVLAQLAHLDHP